MKNLPRRAFTLAMLALPLAARAATGPAMSLEAAISSPTRSARNVKRDRYRHPAAILAFFGLRDDETVLEIEPGGGYWTEILAPYLAPHGHYIAATPPAAAGPEDAKALAFLKAKLLASPAYGHVPIVPFTPGVPLAPPGSIDMILSFRNLHDWMANGTVAANLALIFAALKSGGVFGIEDHRASPLQPQDPKATSGYVREDYAVKLITQAGFQLVGRSAIGDNPRDLKNYPKGVWTLPPVLALGAVDRAKYLAIGESDRWTLKFIKPAAA